VQTLTHKCGLAKLPCVLLFAVLAVGCAWQKTMAFPSPSRKASVEIWQTRFANEWGTRVLLVTSQGRKTVFQNRREAIVYFVQVYWSPDETEFGILSTGMNIWFFGCDARTGKEIPFDRVRQGLAQAISETYHVPHGEDPIGWAATSNAHVAFFRLHPEVRLTYH